MESIDRLRDYGHARVDSALLDYADAIEAEIAEKYMLLPVDADEITVHLGDELESIDTGERGIVTGLTVDSVQCDASALWELASHYHHVKPCTIKDVLREFGLDCQAQEDELSMAERIDKYINELMKIIDKS